MFFNEKSDAVCRTAASLFFSVFTLCMPTAAIAQPAKKTPTSSLQRPKLVVGLVIDQMRWDYLYRYYDRYGTGGLKRMLSEGFSCENTFINYLPSATAVGHTTIYSGSVPAISGITGNDWTDQLSGKSVYCTDDSTVQTVGSTSKAGEMSPRNLRVSTITDELRLATNLASRVIGVSLKDRASILPAGHMPTGSFWFDDASGKFITSTYYAKQLPEWVDQFNNLNEPERLTAKGWTTLYPLQTYKASSADDVPWEGRFKNEKTSAFPHDVGTLYKEQHSVIRNTPFGNTLTFDLARAALNYYHLGNGPSTDFLTINCASTDYVGHMFGINAIETEDTYLRLDKDLASFFTLLDEQVGKNNYTVFLTADHGAAHSIEYIRQFNIPSEQSNAKQILTQLNQLLKDRFGQDNLVISTDEYQVSYNLALLDKTKLDFSAVKVMTIDYLRKLPGVLLAVDMEKLGESSVPEPIKTKLVNSYYYKRSGAVAFIPESGWFAGQKTGTSHGTWNPFDTHIPLLFMGKGIKHGSTNRMVNMSDISPTLAALLHIQVPNGAVGAPITEITASMPAMQ